MRNFLWLVMILALIGGCKHADGTPTTPQENVDTFRTITHAVATGYCAVHQWGQPLVLAAEGVWPPLTMVAVAADLFCRHVQSRDNASGGAPQSYTITPTGFTTRE